MNNQPVEGSVCEVQKNFFGLTFSQVLAMIIQKNNLSAFSISGYTPAEHLGEGSRKVKTMANRLRHSSDLPNIQISASDFLSKDFEEEILPVIKRDIGYDFTALAVHSLFLSGLGQSVYVPMMDFEASRTLTSPDNPDDLVSQKFVIDLLSVTGQDGFILASSEEGLHFVGEKITDEDGWKKFTLMTMLTHDCDGKASIDLRWLIHRLLNGVGQTKLRVWYDVAKIGPFKKGWRTPVVIARMKDGIFHTKPEFWLPGGLSSLPVK